jgi:calcineurin-like phosphoesterase family protein
MKATPQVFFTADTHYHHRNLVRGESKWANKSGCRDFDTLEENDIKLIEGINSTVGVDDVLFHLGDFSFGDIKYYKEFRSQIKCQNIYLIYGNHDGWIIRNDSELQGMFKECSFYREVTYNGQKIIMSHYGFRVWNKSHEGSWMLHGHSHGSLAPSVSGPLITELLDKGKHTELRMLADGTHPDVHSNGKTMDVGVDTHWDFRPYSFDEIAEIMKTKNIARVDAHKEGADDKI